jgi:UDP-2,4-diacetamido-2,4,6-trideoxy-beta-L-altropyranose hydrolase
MVNGQQGVANALGSVVFRADASRVMGTGHVMRCLTLADALAVAGARCRFVTRANPGHLGDLIRRRGHDVVLLPVPVPVPATPAGDLAHAAWLGVDQRSDSSETAAAIADDAPDWIVVDHYALDHRWETSLRGPGRRIMAIDDLADRVHDCDLLLDQNVMADAEHRYDGLVPASCGRMIGPRFALLQPAYAERHAGMAPRTGPVRRILVSFGGGDVAAITAKALAGVIPLLDGSFSIDVVINGALPSAETIRALVAGESGVVLHESPPGLAPLIAAADLAIGAAGSTALERCCLGLPSIVVTLAANQRPGAEEMHRLGLVEWLGDEGEVDSGQIGAAVAAALRAGDVSERSRRCLELLDGRGTATVAGFLLLGPSTSLTARRAIAADEALLLQWANDPAVRANSFNSATIDPDSHHRWFRGRLDAVDDFRLFMVVAHGSLPIAQVRFDRIDQGWLINYSLDARARSRGLGAACLETAIKACDPRHESRFLGMVKAENVASTRVFEQLRFELISRDPHLTFERQRATAVPSCQPTGSSS